MARLGDYELQIQIGAGSSGTVWKALLDGPIPQIVAVKRLRGPAPSPDDIVRLRREAMVLRDLDHPHIVRMIAVLPDGDGLAICMQYASGGSLEALLADRGRLRPGEVVAVAAPIADALASAHRRDIFHVDVKPANILFTSDGEPLLGDFGVARTLGRLTTALGGETATAGTAHYLAPELLDGAAPDARSDVYSLGVVCYEALTGKRPYDAALPLAVLRAADVGRFEPLADRPDIPAPLARVVEQAMARDAEHRPATAAQFAAALRATIPLADVRLPGPPGDEPPPPPRPAEPGLGTLHIPPPPPPPPDPRPAPTGTSGTEAPATHSAGAPPAAAPLAGRPGAAPPEGSPARAPGNQAPATRGSAGPPAGAAGAGDEGRRGDGADGTGASAGRAGGEGPGAGLAELARGRPPAIPVTREDDIPVDGTRTFGPRPPRSEPPPPRDRRVGLWVAVGAMVASFAGLAYWVTRPGPPDDDCADEAWPTADPSIQVVEGDPEGDGCPTFGTYRMPPGAETLDDMVLTITIDDEDRQIRLGELGDSLFLGDWDCDGTDTPGLYRWRDGEVEYFNRWPDVENEPYEPDDSGRVERRSEARLVPGEGDDCDTIEVPADDGSS